MSARCRTAPRPGPHASPGRECLLVVPKVMRAEMGAHFVLDLHERSHSRNARCIAGEVLARCNGRGDVLGGVGRRHVWLFGGEGQGLTADTLLAANRRLRIPIDSRVESLNVGAAAAVCLFEQKRRRQCFRDY